jgi:hypothetical protein
MNRTKVLITDGTSSPRRCATQTPSGSIDAAMIFVISIFRGAAGMSIDQTRMTTVFHERRSRVSTVGACAHVLSIATPMAFMTR